MKTETNGYSNIIQAVVNVMKETATIPKTGWNAFHKYKYATEEDALDVIRPAMENNGLALFPDCTEFRGIDEYGNTHLMMSYTLAHVSGEIWPDKIRIPGSGNDKNKNGVTDKGTYKALTGANKYALFKLFQVATGDKQPTQQSSDPESTSEADQNSGGQQNSSYNSSTDERPLTQKQKGMIKSIMKKKNIPPEQCKDYVRAVTGDPDGSSKSLQRRNMDGILLWMENWKPGTESLPLNGEGFATDVQFDDMKKLNTEVEELNMEGAAIGSCAEVAQELNLKLGSLTEEQAAQVLDAVNAQIVAHKSSRVGA